MAYDVSPEVTTPLQLDDREWARRAFRRVQYDTLCALQAFGLGAHGRQRIEEYAREQGFTLPGMVQTERGEA